MSFVPTDAPEEDTSGVFAPADSGPAETPSAVMIMPPSPEDVARDNARGGRWAMAHAPPLSISGDRSLDQIAGC